MKVCMVVPEFVPSMGKPPFYIAKRLIGNGHEVSILTSDRDLADRKIKGVVKELEGAKTVRFRSLMVSKKIIPPMLIFALLSERADVIYADGFGHFSSALAALIGRLRGIPVVLRADWNGTAIIGSGPRGLYDRYLKFPTLTNSSKILVFSKKQKETMLTYGIDGGKIEVVPNGVEYDEFSDNGNDFRASLKTSPGQKIILTVCRLTPGKNPELAIRTLAKIRSKEAVSLIVGHVESKEYYQALLRTAEELGVKDRVIFMLEVDHKDMPKIYSSADVFFLTSKPIEGMNLSTVEAMCAGLPIITTEVSVTPEIVEEAGCGFIVKGEEDAAEKISRLLSDQNMMKRLGERGKSFARENLDWAKLTQKMEALMLAEAAKKKG